MNKTINWFNRPYPNDFPPLKKLGTGVLIGFFVFLFLMLFQPFGLRNDFPYKVWIIAGYGAVTVLVYVFPAILFPLIFPKFYADERWTVGKEFFNDLLLLFLIAVGNFCYTGAYGYIPWEMKPLIDFIAYTFLVGVFPIGIGILFGQIRLLKRHQIASSNINQGLHSPTDHGSSAENKVDLANEEGKVELSLLPQQIQFLAAADNYVVVHYLDANAPAKHMIRSSLSRISEFLPEATFFRCHRSYVVNLEQVVHAEGNSAGLRLNIAQFEGSVPVSRSKTKDFQTRITAI